MKKALLFGIVTVTLFIFTSCSSFIKTPDDVKTVAVTRTNTEKTTTDNSTKEETMNKARNTISVFGQVAAAAFRNIIIEFPAMVEKINVKEGQKVKNGDSLLTLNLKEFETQIKIKELDLKYEQSDILRITNTYLNSNSNPDIQKMVNELQSAQDLYNKALKDLLDRERLYEAGSISKYDLDEFKTTVENKRKSVENIKLSIDSLKSGKQRELNPRSANILKLESDLSSMKDKLNKPYIRKNEIISDVNNGAVFDIGCAAGDIINSGTKALSLLDLDSLIIKAHIAEKYIKDVKVGSEAVMTLRSDNTRQYRGKVIRISSVPVLRDGEAYTPIEISVDNKDDFLLPNYNVDIKISIDQKSKK